MHFDELQKLLMRDEALINAEDYEKLTTHFRSKIEHERLIAEEQGLDINYTELVKNVMDFRNWFEFKIQYKESGNSKIKELTTGRFNTFSGGERALSLYIPLFAAVAAQYKKAGESAPKIIALDEAFAGVDDSNISEMFGLLEKLDFGYIVNSQALWGCYETVPALEISEPIPLAVLSAEITGNSHYFDRNTTAGKLLIHALAFLSETSEYKNAEQIKTVYSHFLIEPDSISDVVAAVNIRLFDNNNVQHPAYKIFADTGEICLISAANLMNIRYADSDSKTVFIVENQMVFSALSKTAAISNSALLCTSGQIKSSGLRLIDMLMKNNCDIHYAGDFDPEGIQIAENLLHRYNSDRFHIWRMSAEDYLSIEKSNEEISDQRLKKLEKITSPTLKETALLIAENKKAAYQELLIHKMENDITNISA